ncbi:GTPase IMAP family member 4-like protein [Labeo rohita]|uniref:GTPase IMAP family member 4-like protein n=1 Tax=Labeo rohita TaxID=84645 RepID=A0A498MSJ5_LABRO|nr:GTPase IMAP family member 4-like protein [Labeo rohita]
MSPLEVSWAYHRNAREGGCPPDDPDEAKTLILILLNHHHNLEVESELVLVLLGVSGPEKTTVERMILGREESQADSSPATQMKITVDTGEVDGEQVTVINTPDWFSSELSTEEIQRKIQMCIRLSSHGPHAFFLVIPAKQFSEEEKQIVKKMEMIFEERITKKDNKTVCIDPEVQWINKVITRVMRSKRNTKGTSAPAVA